METGLQRIANLSKQAPEKEFFNLIHRVNKKSLRECYGRLDARKAKGIDGVSKSDYGKRLEENLDDLLYRMRKMGYRPQPVKEALIPKEGKPGATRPLGISVFEDKLVQMAMADILGSIYEPLFLDCSYGFRPKRGCHGAIKELSSHLYRRPVSTVIDVDLENFFGTIDHKILEEILRKKIKDKSFMRYIIRMFKAGVLSKGELRISDEGVPQGSIISPVLANILAHYVIDKWFEEVVKKHVYGEVKMVRYADDMVIVCQYEQDAHRIKDALEKRLAKNKLKLNSEKTKLVSFDKNKASQGIHQETFDFLGFTFYLGRSKRKKIIPKLKTRKKSFSSKLKKINEWAKAKRNVYPLKELWRRAYMKLEGHIQYYGVSHNSEWVEKFLRESWRILHKWLNRRSQRKSMTMEQYSKFTERYPLPRARVCYSLF